MANYVYNGIMHFKTITRHRHLVCLHCFKAGIPLQGLVHDLSKYSPTEFIAGVKYFNGNKSPNVMDRIENGYSAAWLHHKGRNKHHFEYWFDNSVKSFTLVPVEMPTKYVVEMVCDRMAACKVYLGDQYDDGSALRYYEVHDYSAIMAPKTEKLLRELLTMLSVEGEKKTFRYMRKLLKDCK